MSDEEGLSFIGYSVFDTGQDCYEYNENACFIASTRASAREFLNGADMDPAECQVHAISWDELLRDFGCSGGEYAMEAAAFARFRSLTQNHNVSFEVEPYDGDDSLLVVDIEHRFLTPDPD